MPEKAVHQNSTKFCAVKISTLDKAETPKKFRKQLQDSSCSPVSGSNTETGKSSPPGLYPRDLLKGIFVLAAKLDCLARKNKTSVKTKLKKQKSTGET